MSTTPTANDPLIAAHLNGKLEIDKRKPFTGSLMNSLFARARNSVRRLFPSAVLLGGLIIIGSAFPVTSALAVTHYVDSTCSTNGNGSSTTCGTSGPWKDLPNINCTSLAPGDHVQIRGGTYYSTWQPPTACSGAANNPIVIENFANENVILDGTTDIHRSGWTSVGGGVWNCTSGTCGTGSAGHRAFAAWYKVGTGAEEHLTMVTGAAVTPCASSLAVGQISYSSQGGPVCVHLFEGISPADATVTYFRIPTLYALIDFANSSSVSWMTVQKNPAGGSFTMRRTALYSTQTTSHNTHITLDGLDIGYNWDRCVSTDESFGTGLLFQVYQNLHVHHCGQEGLRAGADQGGPQIINNEVDHIQTVPDFPFCPNGSTCEISDHAAAIRMAASNNAVIRGNRVHDIGGGQFGKSSGIDLEVGNTNVLVENNYVYNMNTGVASSPLGKTEGAAFLFQPFTSSDLQSGTYRNNRVYLVDMCFEFSPDANMLAGQVLNFYNNTCVDATQFGMTNNNAGAIQMTVNLVNNIFSNPTQAGLPLSIRGTGFVSPKSNAFYCARCGTGTVASVQGTNYTSANIGTLGTGNLYGDPVLTTTGSPPTLSIASASGSAYQHGQVLTPVFPDDLGNVRPAAGVWDIGANAFVLGGTSPLLPPANVRVVP